MIHQKTLQASKVPAVELAAAGYTLSPIPNTYLSDLYGYTVPPLGNLPIGQSDLDAFYDACVAGTVGVHDYSFHDKALEAATNELSKMVTVHIQHLKDKVVPKVDEFKNEYVQHLLQSSVKNPSEDFDIVQYSSPEIIKNDRFLSRILHRENADPISFKDRFSFEPVKSVDELKHIFSLGNPKLDDDISQWISLVGHEWIVKTYNGFLSKSATCYYERISAFNDYEVINHAMLFILVGNATLHMGDSHKWLREYGYDLMFRAVRRLERAQKSGRLVVDIMAVNKTICVDKHVYDTWLASGGSPEVVLGILVSPSNERSYVVTSIDPKVKHYIDAWYQYCAYTKGSENLSRDKNIRSYLKLRIAELIDIVTRNEQSEDYRSEAYKKIAFTLCEREIDSFKEKQLNNPFEVAVTLVAKCIYHKTCAYEFILDMEKASEENKEIRERQDSRAAATVAAIRYLSDYMVSQMGITKVPV